MIPLDERRGVPSASGMERIDNCPASFQMEKVAIEAGYSFQQSKDAEAGKDVHAILSDDAEGEQDYSAEATAEMCENQAHVLYLGWCEQGFACVKLEEQRLGLTSLGGVVQVTPESPADFRFTGQFDRLYVQGNRGFLVDFKALYGSHTAALENRQLASLAVLVSTFYKLKSLRVAIVQPRKGRPTMADYDELTLVTARDWLLQTLDRERRSTPDDRRAGKWCHHCKARLGCDVWKDKAYAVAEPLNLMNIAGADGDTQRKALFARAINLPPEAHAAMVRGAPMLLRLYESIMDAAKARAGDDPEFQKYFRLESKPGNREITDAQAAFTALTPLGITQEDVLAACSIPLGAMEEAARKRSGVKSRTEKRTTYNLTADSAKKAVNEALTAAGAIGRKADTVRLVPVLALEGGAE